MRKPRFSPRMSGRHFAALLLLVLLALPEKSPAQASAPAFAFWYEPWVPHQTITKLGTSGAVIGVGPEVISEIHSSGGKAIQYVTYYKGTPKSPFLDSLADLPQVGFLQAGSYLPSAFHHSDSYVLCDNSKVLHSRVLAYLDASLEKGYDGVFVDNTIVEPAVRLVCEATHSHVRPGARGDDAFLALLADVRTEMQKRHPGGLIIANPGTPMLADQLGTKPPPLWELSDYVLWESYGYSSNRGTGHDRWRSTIQKSLEYSQDANKAAKIVALSYPQDMAEAIYSFALARIFGFRWTANLGERQQGTQAAGGHFGAFLSRIPFELGEPVAAREGSLASSLFHRRFQHGEAYANTGSAPATIPVPAGVKLYLGAQVRPIAKATTTLILPPATAAVWVAAGR